MTDQMTLRLRVLGSVSLRRGSERPSEAQKGTKRTALLVYLTLGDARQAYERDEIVRRFWPGSTDARARAAFRQLVHVLRKDLGTDLIETRGTRVRLRPGALRCDALEFRALAAAGRHEEALDLYHGHLLEGFHACGLPELQDWLEGERRELAEQAARSAWALAEESEEWGDGAGAARWASEGVRLAPFHDAGVRRLMELLGRLGDQTVALATYDELASWLDRRREIDPSPETQALIDVVREGRERVEEAPS
jgi:DNA-binding SARP family transcriptional activator